MKQVHLFICLIAAFIAGGMVTYVSVTPVKETKQCDFDFHVNYSVEGEGIIIYDHSGERRIGYVDYSEAGKIDSIMKRDMFGENRMPAPKAID